MGTPERDKQPTGHTNPYMTVFDYEDLPEGIVIKIPLTYEDRYTALCLDPQHCTIANALNRIGKRIGVKELSHRGVSRTWVEMTLDPRKFPWAREGMVYRGYLPESSAAITVELDSWFDRPKQHQQMKASLKNMADASPIGFKTIFQTVVITAPPPSHRQLYRTGPRGPQPREPRGRRSAHGAPARRYNGPVKPEAEK